MSGYEASDRILPQRNIKYYRLVRKKTGTYLWVVIALFAVIAFLCVNNFMLLHSYKTLKDNLGNAYEKLDSINNAETSLSIEKMSLEKQIARLTAENNNLKKENTIVSRGSNDIEKQIENIKRQDSELLKTNKELTDDNIALQNSLKIAASAGIKPQNYTPFNGLSPSDTVNRGKYIGKFLGTAYTPSEDECGNNKGITSSGVPVIPGVTVAVDNKLLAIWHGVLCEGLGVYGSDGHGQRY